MPYLIYPKLKAYIKLNLLYSQQHKRKYGCPTFCPLVSSRNDCMSALLLLYNNKNSYFFSLVYQKECWSSFLSYKTNQQLFSILYYKTNWKVLFVLSNYEYESWLLFAHLVYKHQCQPNFGEDIIHKSILDYVVSVKYFLCKKSKKPNIPPKVEFTLNYELGQNLSLFLSEELDQNLDIVQDNAKKALKMIRKPRDKTYSYFSFLSPKYNDNLVYNDNSARLAISLLLTTQNTAIINLKRKYD